MIPVNYIRRSTKSHPEGIRKGSAYYWWMYHGKKRYSKTPPRKSQLTYSQKLRRLFLAQEAVEAVLTTVDGFEPDVLGLLQGVVKTAAQEINDVANLYFKHETYYLDQLLREYVPPQEDLPCGVCEDDDDFEDDEEEETLEDYNEEWECTARVSNLCRDKALVTKEVARQLSEVNFDTLPPFPQRKDKDTWDGHSSVAKARKAYRSKLRILLTKLKSIKWEFNVNPNTNQNPDHEVITDKVHYVTRANYAYPNGVKAGEPYCWWKAYGRKHYASKPPRFQAPHGESGHVSFLQKILHKVHSRERPPNDLQYYIGDFMRLMKNFRKSLEEVQTVFPNDLVIKTWEKKIAAAKSVVKALQSAGILELPPEPVRHRYKYINESEDSWNGCSSYKKAVHAHSAACDRVLDRLTEIDFQNWLAVIAT